MIKKFFRAFKQHRWVRWLTVVLVGTAAMFGLANLGARPAGTDSSHFDGNAPNAEVAWGDTEEKKDIAAIAGHLKNSSDDKVRELEAKSQELQKELDKARSDIKQSKETQDKTIQDLQNALQELIERSKNAPPENHVGPQPISSADPTLNVGPARIRKIDIANKKPELKTKRQVVRIPPGTFVKAKLLTGVYAPAQGQALPVLLKLESIGWGPNHSRLPIRDAFIVGKANGDPNSARAIIQLEILSLVLEDGRTIEAHVNGYVTDEDGIQGVAGTYVYRTSEIVTLAAITKGLGTGADALSQRNLTSTVNPLGGVQKAITGDAMEYSGLQIVGGTLDALSQVVAKRADQIQPAVFTSNGKTVTAIFINGVDLPGLEGEIQGSSKRTPFEGLDVHR